MYVNDKTLSSSHTCTTATEIKTNNNVCRRRTIVHGVPIECTGEYNSKRVSIRISNISCNRMTLPTGWRCYVCEFWNNFARTVLTTIFLKTVSFGTNCTARTVRPKREWKMSYAFLQCNLSFESATLVDRSSNFAGTWKRTDGFVMPYFTGTPKYALPP